jgi:hypothetical protein
MLLPTRSATCEQNSVINGVVYVGEDRVVVVIDPAMEIGNTEGREQDDDYQNNYTSTDEKYGGIGLSV